MLKEKLLGKTASPADKRIARKKEQTKLIEAQQPLRRPILQLLADRDKAQTFQSLVYSLNDSEREIRNQLVQLRDDGLIKKNNSPTYSMTIVGEIALRDHNAFGKKMPRPKTPTKEQTAAFLRAALGEAIVSKDKPESKAERLELISEQALATLDVQLIKDIEAAIKKNNTKLALRLSLKPERVGSSLAQDLFSPREPERS
jgi:hypothetical protein